MSKQKEFVTVFKRRSLQQELNESASARTEMVGKFSDTQDRIPYLQQTSNSSLSKWDRTIKMDREGLDRQIVSAVKGASIEEQFREADRDERDSNTKYGKFRFKKLTQSKVLADKYLSFGSGGMIELLQPERYDTSYKLGGTRYPIGKGDFNAIHHRTRPGQLDSRRMIDGSRPKLLS